MKRQEYMKKYNNQYTKSLKGLCKKIYFHQIRNCDTRNHPHPTYTSEELETWIRSDSTRLQVYTSWISSGYDPELIPSVDRLDNTKSYAFDNIELVTWKENKERAYQGIKSKTLPNSGLLNDGHRDVDYFSENGVYLGTFISLSEAARILALDHRMISRACYTKHMWYANYFWAYTDERATREPLFTAKLAEKLKSAYTKSKGFTVTLTSDVATHSFSSLGKAANFLGSAPKTIRKYAELSQPLQGYTITIKETI